MNKLYDVGMLFLFLAGLALGAWGSMVLHDCPIHDPSVDYEAGRTHGRAEGINLAVEALKERRDEYSYAGMGADTPIRDDGMEGPQITLEDVN
jgi:hypothetical protein